MTESADPMVPESSAKVLHRQAMEAADRADALRRAGEMDEARAAFEEAYRLESEAAKRSKTQPSIAILHRSAAWLALEAEEPRIAEMLACAALAREDTAPGFAEQLRAVAEEARVRMVARLPPPGVASNITMHLDGPGIGNGTIHSAILHPRTEALQNMLIRTKERQRKLGFRRNGPPQRAVVRDLNLRLRHRPGSVVLVIETGGDQAQIWDDNADTVKEVVTGIELAHGGRFVELERLIPDQMYRDNFIALARVLEPDGTQLCSVDVTANVLRADPLVVRLRPDTQADRNGGRGKDSGGRDPKPTEIIGVLNEASNLKGNRIAITIEGSGGVRRIKVAEALLNDIVRPYYGRRVRVTVEKRAKQKGEWLQTITEVNSQDESTE